MGDEEDEGTPLNPEDVPPKNELEEFTKKMKRRHENLKKKFRMGPPPAERTAEEKKMDDITEQIKMYREVDEEDIEEEDSSNAIWVDKPWYESFISFVIVINTIVIGVELDDEHGHDGRYPIWIVIEILFMLIFCSEVYFKIKYHTWRWIFWDQWNLFTTFIAAMAVVDGVILQAAGLHGKVRMLSLLRVIKVVRILRVIRSFKNAKELRLVMQGLVGSVNMLTWTLIILVAFLYVCAVFTTSTIGRSDVFDDFRTLTNGWDHDELFGTVGRSMYTLLQCMTRDGWASSIARYVSVQQWYMGFFFIGFMLISTYGLLNLVVSVIVEQTLTAARSNESRVKNKEEQAHKDELQGLKEVFEIVDKDGSGELDINEFMQALTIPEVLWKMRSLDLQIDDAASLFTVMDGEGSRPLSMAEFIEGCTKLKGPARSRDLLAITSQADALTFKMDTMSQELQESERMLHRLDDISIRITNRFDPAIKSSRKKIAKSIGGSAPVVPMHPDKLGSAMGLDLGVGNRPLLPKFPNLLN